MLLNPWLLATKKQDNQNHSKLKKHKIIEQTCPLSIGFAYGVLWIKEIKSPTKAVNWSNASQRSGLFVVLFLEVLKKQKLGKWWAKNGNHHLLLGSRWAFAGAAAGFGACYGLLYRVPASSFEESGCLPLLLISFPKCAIILLIDSA